MSLPCRPLALYGGNQGLDFYINKNVEAGVSSALEWRLSCHIHVLFMASLLEESHALSM